MNLDERQKYNEVKTWRRVGRRFARGCESVELSHPKPELLLVEGHLDATYKKGMQEFSFIGIFNHSKPSKTHEFDLIFHLL